MLWMWAAFAEVEPKAEEEVSEVVISWAKPFKRFDDTRWVVRSEVITPTPAALGSVETPIRANAWQIEAIIHCVLEDERGRLREANCTVEDAALRIHSPRHSKPRDQAAIEHTRSLIVGSRMQLQVNHKGGVPNLDVEGIEEDNFQERRLQGGVHQIMRVLSSAFHMNISKSAPLRTDWESTREPLLTMPALTVGQSSNRIANRIDPVDDHWIWQSIGKATSRSPVPHPMAGMICMSLDGGPCRSYRYPEYQGDLHYTYAIDFNAVTVIDPGKGYPVERLWSSLGRPTPSSPGSVSATDYWSAGNLRELDDDEMPELGATGIVGAPQSAGGAFPPWISVAQSWWNTTGSPPVPGGEELLWFMVSALAERGPTGSEDQVSETVIAWAKPFKRFDDTRWVVRSEVITPTWAPLGSVKTPIQAHAWQLEAIIHCQLADEKGRLREANCSVEDAAIRVHSPRKVRDQDQVAIQHTRSLIVGSRIQLQVNARGGVPNLDIEDVEADNYPERRLQGGLHQIMRMLTASFHMNISKTAPLRTDWESTREPLLTMPASAIMPAANRVANRIDPVGDHWIWQAIGQATARSPIPNPRAGMVCMGPTFGDSCLGYRHPEYTGDFFSYSIDFNAVTVIDPGKGYPVERLWSSLGRPTPSSPGSMNATDYWSAGNLRELDENETPELGITGMIGAPQKLGGDLPTWVSIAHAWEPAEASLQ